MKKLCVLAAVLFIALSCTKENTNNALAKKLTVLAYGQSHPKGFVLDLAADSPLNKGYVFDLNQGDNSAESAVENALTGEGTVAGWKDGETMVYRSVKVIEDRAAAMEYGQKNDMPLMFDLKNNVPVPTSDIDEFKPGKTVQHGVVTIESMPKMYYQVTIDFTKEKDKKKIGADYCRCINDLYIWYYTRLVAYTWGSAKTESISDYEQRMNDIQPSLDQDSKDLIDGFITQMWTCVLMSKRTAIYTANLLPDVLRPASCSAYGVMPPMSETGETLVHRNLDWPDYPYMYGQEYPGLVSPLQSVTKMIYSDKVIYSFGLLGLFNAITAIDATNRNMVGILDSGTAGTYSSKGKSSYVFDLMNALRTCSTTDQIAAKMTDPGRTYAFNHLILLADKDQVRVVENSIDPLLPGAAGRAVRSWDSQLATHVTPAWPFDNLIGVVNCFMLPGQVNNFNKVNGADLNVHRWKQQIEKTQEVLDSRDSKKLNMTDIRKIECYSTGTLEEKTWFKNLYNTLTFQMIEYIPAQNQVWAFFKPFDASTPADPLSKFVEIKLQSGLAE